MVGGLSNGEVLQTKCDLAVKEIFSEIVNGFVHYIICN